MRFRFYTFISHGFETEVVTVTQERWWVGVWIVTGGGRSETVRVHVGPRDPNEYEFRRRTSGTSRHGSPRPTPHVSKSRSRTSVRSSRLDGPRSPFPVSVDRVLPGTRRWYRPSPDVRLFWTSRPRSPNPRPLTLRYPGNLPGMGIKQKVSPLIRFCRWCEV